MNKPQSDTAIQEKDSFKSYFQSDSALRDRDSPDVLTISNGSHSEEILAICNCDKNADENSIKIQISVAIPTKTELEEGSTGGRTFMGLREWPKQAQFRFLTFHVKDSTIERTQLFYKSLEKVFDNSDFKYANITDHQVRISKFDYSTASEVFGKSTVVLPGPFGYFNNDTLLSGTFACNNWRIKSLEEVKKWDLEDFFKQYNGTLE